MIPWTNSDGEVMIGFEIQFFDEEKQKWHTSSAGSETSEKVMEWYKDSVSRRPALHWRLIHVITHEDIIADHHPVFQHLPFEKGTR